MRAFLNLRGTTVQVVEHQCCNLCEKLRDKLKGLVIDWPFQIDKSVLVPLRFKIKPGHYLQWPEIAAVTNQFGSG